ncbi:MAG TPA: glycosyltransferase family 2 protein [Candidatus Binatia bacterium]|jgi:dolichol-phosphate mannosyltransferase
MSSKALVSIVTPVFNEAEVIELFYERVRRAMAALDSIAYELIFVDDGSTDGSYDKLVAIANANADVRIIKFSRNFGHQIAITAGIELAKGDAVVVIDADLQDPPELIKVFVAKWQEGFDVVYGVRDKRDGESRLKLLTAAAFYRLLQRIIKLDIPVDVGDFRLMSRRVVEYFTQLKEKDRFVRGLVSWIGFKQTGVHYARDKRFAGETKFPYRKMIKFALDGITSFSDIPLKLATWLGYFTSFLALLYLLSVFVQKALGDTVQGWATIMVAVLFLGGVQLISLGIIGEYIGRIFNEVKQRPLYVVDEIYPVTQNAPQSSAGMNVVNFPRPHS